MIDQLKVKSARPEYGRVAVMMGGSSAERDISLQTGKAVVESLRRSKVQVAELQVADINQDVVSQLVQVDRVFIAMHGSGGEDGRLQGLLSSLGIPFTGSDVLGSALAMDKLKTKQI